MDETILTKENYTTNHYYMSYSRFNRFLRCEAAAAANYREPTSTSLLVGSYVDAYFSNEFDEFKSTHPEIFNSRTGELKAEYKQADEIIKRIEQDELLSFYMSGEKQKIMAGKILDVPFKIKMDSYKENEFIADLKILKDFNKVWSDTYNSHMSFVEAFDYDVEMAIFQEIAFQNTGKRLPCYLVCVTKETPSDVGIFQIPQENLDRALDIVKHNLPRIKGILNGEIAPYRCNKCNYCKSTKKATVLSIDYIGFNGDRLREEGIVCEDPKLKK